MDNITAVIPAAGQGKRMKSGTNKQFMALQGMPVIAHTLKVFQDAPEITGIVLVCAPGEEEYYTGELMHKYQITKPVKVVPGGQERQDSVYRGLAAVGSDCRYVMIHDGARPLVTCGLISRVAGELDNTDAITVGVPVKDTIKRTDKELIVTETLVREGLWHIQTPQAFAVEVLLPAHETARDACYLGTDDAALVERLGHPVKVVAGSYENIKITTPEDIALAETILKGRGQG